MHIGNACHSIGVDASAREMVECAQASRRQQKQESIDILQTIINWHCHSTNAILAAVKLLHNENELMICNCSTFPWFVGGTCLCQLVCVIDARLRLRTMESYGRLLLSHRSNVQHRQMSMHFFIIYSKCQIGTIAIHNGIEQFQHAHRKIETNFGNFGMV